MSHDDEQPDADDLLEADDAFESDAPLEAAPLESYVSPVSK